MTRFREWKIARHTLALGGRTLIMGVLNVTPDSFSDGGQFFDPERAAARAAEMLADGADIIDIGGESTRPGGAHVTAEEELRRIVPVIERLRAQLPGAVISVDTTKAEVARRALDAGAEIVNDISALRFDERVADVVARTGAGLVLMHSRGTPTTLHTLPPVANIMREVSESLSRSIAVAEQHGVERARMAIDPGIGFGKSQEQNLELLAGLDALAARFADFPLLVGTSRKSFVGRLLGDAPPERRLHGTMASVTAAILGGAHIVRVHDVRATVETARIADAIRAVTSDR
ncbi:MAG TPA: dihydropteroate synthase [Pyrinomonadaceae bacterium]|nr:dihydropteroate synthase [Pyrinomonadaceae bacterium]